MGEAEKVVRYWEEGYNSANPGPTEELAKSKEQGKSGGQKKPAESKTKGTKPETEQKPEKDWHVRALYGSRNTVLLSIPLEIVKEAGLRKGMKIRVGYDRETDTITAKITERPGK